MIIKKTRRKRDKYNILQDGGSFKTPLPNGDDSGPLKPMSGIQAAAKGYRESKMRSQRYLTKGAKFVGRLALAPAIAPLGLATGVLAGISKTSKKKAVLKQEKYKTDKLLNDARNRLKAKLLSDADNSLPSNLNTDPKYVLNQIKEYREKVLSTDPESLKHLSDLESMYKIIDALKDKSELIESERRKLGTGTKQFFKEWGSQTWKSVKNPLDYLVSTPTRVLEHSFGTLATPFRGLTWSNYGLRGLSPKWYVKTLGDRIKHTQFAQTKEMFRHAGTRVGRSFKNVFGDDLPRSFFKLVSKVAPSVDSGVTSRRVSQYLKDDAKTAARLAQKIEETQAKLKYEKLRISSLEGLSYLTSDQQFELNGYRYSLKESQKSLDQYMYYHSKVKDRIKKTASLLGVSEDGVKSTGIKKLYEAGTNKYLDIISDTDKVKQLISVLKTADIKGLNEKVSKLDNPVLKGAKFDVDDIITFVGTTLPRFKELKSQTNLNDDEKKELKELEKEISLKSINYSNAMEAYSKLFDPKIGIYRDTEAADRLKQYSKELTKFYRFNTELNLVDLYKQSAEALAHKINDTQGKTKSLLEEEKAKRLFKGTTSVFDEMADRLERITYLRNTETKGKEPIPVHERIKAAKEAFEAIKRKRIETSALLKTIKSDRRFQDKLDYDLVKGAILALDPATVNQVKNNPEIVNADQFRAALIQILEKKNNENKQSALLRQSRYNKDNEEAKNLDRIIGQLQSIGSDKAEFKKFGINLQGDEPWHNSVLRSKNIGSVETLSVSDFDKLDIVTKAAVKAAVEEGLRSATNSSYELRKRLGLELTKNEQEFKEKEDASSDSPPVSSVSSPRRNSSISSSSSLLSSARSKGYSEENYTKYRRTVSEETSSRRDSTASVYETPEVNLDNIEKRIKEAQDEVTEILRKLLNVATNSRGGKVGKNSKDEINRLITKFSDAQSDITRLSKLQKKYLLELPPPPLPKEFRRAPDPPQRVLPPPVPHPLSSSVPPQP